MRFTDCKHTNINRIYIIALINMHTMSDIFQNGFFGFIPLFLPSYFSKTYKLDFYFFLTTIKCDHCHPYEK